MQVVVWVHGHVCHVSPGAATQDSWRLARLATEAGQRHTGQS